MKRYPLTLKALLVLGLCVLVSACAGQNFCWYNAKKTLQETKMDRFQCEEAAVTYCNDTDAAGNKDLITLRMIACMRDSKDYQLVLESSMPKDGICVK